METCFEIVPHDLDDGEQDLGCGGAQGHEGEVGDRLVPDLHLHLLLLPVLPLDRLHHGGRGDDLYRLHEQVRYLGHPQEHVAQGWTKITVLAVINETYRGPF